MIPNTTGLLINDQTPTALVMEFTAWFSANSGSQPIIIRLNGSGHTTVSGNPEFLISLLTGTPEYPLTLTGLIIEADPEGYLSSLQQGEIPDSHPTERTLLIRINEVFQGVRSEVSSGRFRLTGHARAKNARQLFRSVLQLLKETTDRISNGRVRPLSTLPDIHPTNKHAENGILHTYHSLFTTYKWNIGIIHQPIHEVAFSKNRLNVDWLEEAPGNDFRADPFGFIQHGQEHILYEYFDYRRRKGYLRKRDQSGDHPYLETAAHLSYPYIFDSKERLLLTPESAASGTITLYSTDRDLPTAEKNILDAAAVDPTIFHYHDQWWLFFTDKNRQGADLKLNIYFSSRPEGPWTPHLLNPVKTDICTARPGGTPFIHNGKLYRPAQDSSTGYGSALYIMEITELTKEKYREIPVHRLTADLLTGPYTEGFHTLSAFGNKTLVDAKRRRRTIQPFLRLLVK